MKFNRKIIITLAALLMIICVSGNALAVPFSDTGIKTKYIMLMDAGTGIVLYEKAAHERAFPASTTKIMTCILALEKGNLDDVVTVPSVTNRGSALGIRKGEKISLRSLIYGMMLVSGNDCAEAVAVHVGGTKAGFVEMMNQKAQELGMKETHFTQPSGLHDEEHYSSAYDFAVLTRYALMQSPKKDDFRAIIKRPTYTIDDSSRTYKTLENTNRLLYTPAKADGTKDVSYEYRGAIGVKTGDTDYAMRCIVAAAERDGVTLITVQFYDTEKFDRFQLAARLFDWGFENFTTQTAESLKLSATIDVPVVNYSFNEEIEKNGGKLALDINLKGKEVSGDKEMLDDIRNNPDKITMELINVKEVVAPVEQGQVVATVAYKYNGEVLFTAEATASKSVLGLASPAGNTPRTLSIGEMEPKNKSAGPWLFITLVGVGLLFITGLVVYIRSRKRQRRRSRRRMRNYGGRR